MLVDESRDSPRIHVSVSDRKIETGSSILLFLEPNFWSRLLRLALCLPIWLLKIVFSLFFVNYVFQVVLKLIEGGLFSDNGWEFVPDIDSWEVKAFFVCSGLTFGMLRWLEFLVSRMLIVDIVSKLFVRDSEQCLCNIILYIITERS